MKNFMLNGVRDVSELESLKHEKINESHVMLTIVCNKTMYDPDSEEFKNLYDKFKYLGNYILNDPVKVLRFVRKMSGGTGKEMFTTLDRDENMDKILEIKDQVGTVESTGERGLRKMHIHVGFTVVHKTMIQGDDDRAKFIAKRILGVPENFIHVKFKCTGGMMSYIRKYAQ